MSMRVRLTQSSWRHDSAFFFLLWVSEIRIASTKYVTSALALSSVRCSPCFLIFGGLAVCVCTTVSSERLLPCADRTSVHSCRWADFLPCFLFWFKASSLESSKSLSSLSSSGSSMLGFSLLRSYSSPLLSDAESTSSVLVLGSGHSVVHLVVFVKRCTYLAQQQGAP